MYLIALGNDNTIMERLLVFQHAPHETLGIFAELAHERGIQVDRIRLWEDQKVPDLRQYAKLLVLGGPQSVYDSLVQYPTRDLEVETIRLFTRREKPVLAICLGSQLVASAFGGCVYPNKVNGKLLKETGFYQMQLTAEGKSDPLFREFPQEFEVFHWHGDVFEVPPHGKLLVTGQHVQNQAFVYGTFTYGVLFHVEVTSHMVQELIRVDKQWLHQENAVDEQAILEQAYQSEKTLRDLGSKLFYGWINL